jgi:uncharacterized protein (DUF983 family)
MQPVAPASKGQMLRRGFAKHCARCGSGHLFPKWFDIVDDCPQCGLHFEREQGYWAGALAINIGFTAAVFAITLITALAFTIPKVPVAPILAVLIPLMIILPIVFYPFSKTIWVAVDRALLQHMDAGERLDEQM